ncbi:integrator complex assembly factor WDR73 [Gouania willdenowi]|uniref:WD repeat-containing protein 73 n=1 Tax=Gouania willdenowi TaxID=441366 RepID=A0A8C5GXX3_GOUWI|nr:WD repeat-containing protein 73 [Gouania willdenowi]
MEDSEFEDVLDDWFIESLKTYKDLHVYQLEHPTKVIEWTSEKTVCVAGYTSSKNEILELRLPLKLLADKNKGLCAERDFKVTYGGFTEGAVCCLTHVPGTRCLVTNDGLSSDLQLWELGGDDSDVIRRTGLVQGRSLSDGGSKIAAQLSPSPQVLHGGLISDVLLTELSSGLTVYKLETQSSDRLSSLQFESEAVFLAGCTNGSVYVADTRTSAAPQLLPPPESSHESVQWWADVCAGPHLSCSRLIRLSSVGVAVVSDLRNAGTSVSRAQLDVNAQRSNPDIRVCWSPTLHDYVSVSGFGGVVEIYNVSSWSTDSQVVAESLFQHRGHAVSSNVDVSVVVTAHTWHPERPRTLMSAASDGSVHVWDWVEPHQSA